jgi:hypothetical protein
LAQCEKRHHPTYQISFFSPPFLQWRLIISFFFSPVIRAVT